MCYQSCKCFYLEITLPTAVYTFYVMHAEGYKAVDLCTHYKFMVKGRNVIGRHYTVQTESSYAVHSLLHAMQYNPTSRTEKAIIKLANAR